MKYLIEIHHGFGDVVQMTTAIDYIIHYDNEAKIDLILEKAFYKSLFQNDSRIHRYYFIDLSVRKNKYSTILNELHKIRNNFYDYYFVSGISNKKYSILLAMIVKANYKIGEQFNRLSMFSKKYICVKTLSKHMVGRNFELVKSIIGKGQFFYPRLQGTGNIEEKMIGFVIGSSDEKKNWSIKNFAEVGEFYIKRGYKIVLLGGDNEKELISKSGIDFNGFINVAGKTTLAEVIGWTQKCELVIGCDTGIMHIASSMGVQTLTLFGPSNPYIFSPYSKYSYIYEIENKLDCQYCYDKDPGFKCSKGFECMNMIKPCDIINISEKILHNESSVSMYRVIGRYAEDYER